MYILTYVDENGKYVRKSFPRDHSNDATGAFSNALNAGGKCLNLSLNVDGVIRPVMSAPGGE
jgi:hypothetical protein